MAEPLDLAAALKACAGDEIHVGGAPDERALLGRPAAAPVVHECTVSLFIGPEGGWTPDEAARLAAAGALPLDLGPFTLRTETAAIVGLAALRALAAGAGPQRS